MKRRYLCLVPLIAIAVTACVPGTPGSSSRQGEAVAGQPRTLRVVTRVEPAVLAGLESRAKGEFPFRVFDAGLSSTDNRDVPYPVLAESLPQLNTDTWMVSPNGTARTIYRLRPGLTWHDGTPLTADDFVFALRSYRDQVAWGVPPPTGREEFGPLKLVDKIDTLDPRTMAIHWNATYAGVGSLPFQPLPQHLLQSWLDLNDKDIYMSRDFWTTGHVGVGPFRLARWERGGFMEGQAFDGFALGRPKIDRILLTFNSDPNVTVVQLLGEAVDMAVDRAIEFQQITALKQQGSVQGTQPVFLLSPIELRYVQLQARPDYVNPRALLDLRVRRALLHAINRPALAEAMVEDAGAAAEAMAPKGIRFYPAIERAITKYPFDVRRTEQLMGEAGFRKGADGIFASPTEGRFSPEVSGVSEGQEAQDTTIVADYFTGAGVDARLSLIPASLRVSNDEMKGSYPALTVNSNPLQDTGLSLIKFNSRNVGSPANDWRGSNRGGWFHLEYDRLVAAFGVAVDLNEADVLMGQMVTFLNEELPTLPLYFNFDVTTHVGSLRGPATMTPYSTPYTNIHEWVWQ